MRTGSSSETVTREANIVRGPESRRADAEAVLAKLGLAYQTRTDGPTVTTYTDFDPEPTWIVALGDADQAARVKELLDREG